MTENRIVKETIDLLGVFFAGHKSFDTAMASFFRERKYIGSKERRAIAELAYAIFRSYEKIRFLNRKITNDWSRFLVITHLAVNMKYSLKRIIEIFDGRHTSPDRLSDFEKRFISTIVEYNGEYPQHAILNYPEWADKYLRRAFPEDFEVELVELNKPATVDLRVNLLKSSVDDVVRILTEDGYEAKPTEISNLGVRIHGARISKSHKIITDGMADIQDEGSQIIALECNPQSSDVVVDLCAGAGGKTLALAALMNNKGRIYATDVNEKRIERAKLRLRHANVSNTHCNMLTGKWLKRHKDVADLVLVDAPCSGSGTWRRNPDMIARLTEQTITEVVEKQREILDSAKGLVKIGGRLVYATCSVFMEENEDQVEWFLKNNPNFEILRPTLVNQDKDFIKMSPHKTQTDGFFCVKFIRRS